MYKNLSYPRSVCLRSTLIAAVAALVASTNVMAEQAVPLEAEDLLKLLQEEGVITEKQAESVRNIARDRLANESQTSVDHTSVEDKDLPPASDPDVTRVPYIPEYLKDEIRDEVRMGLKEDVVDDVMTQAKNESWGVPGTNPSWTKRIKFDGDIRFRYQADRFDEENSIQYFDFNAINDAGGLAYAGIDGFINTREDRDRLRLRMRLGMNAKVTQGVSVGMRLATGGTDNPVSTNQTLGGYGNRYAISLDRAYIKFNSYTNDSILYMGRMPNPWLSTELVWDEDLNFDGIAYSYYFNRSDDMYDDERKFDPFITFGAFPLQEVELSSRDKWLLGAQAGFSYLADNQNEFKLGLSYYHFLHIDGQRNEPDSTANNYTAPPFVQKGNSMYDISNDTTDPDTQLFALAAEYQEVNLTALYDFANLAPVHVILTADYVVNIGYDEEEVSQRFGEPRSAQTQGYDLGINVGWPTPYQRGNWNVGLNYRYLERDAVLDAFTDSDFHLGGTDMQGYKLSFRYGVEENTWLQFRLISSNEIDLEPFSVLTFMADVNARF